MYIDNILNGFHFSPKGRSHGEVYFVSQFYLTLTWPQDDLGLFDLILSSSKAHFRMHVQKNFGNFRDCTFECVFECDFKGSTSTKWN